MSLFPPFDAARAVGVILGASQWPEMRALSRAENGDTLAKTADYWHNLMVQPDRLGLNPANVLSLFDDRSSPHDQFERLSHFLTDRGRRAKAARERLHLTGGLQDLILVYIGHGVEPGEGESRFHLCPRCARDGRTDTLIDPVNLRQVLATAVPGVACHLFIDACYAGNVEHAFGGWGDLPVALLCAVDAETQALARAVDDLTRFATHMAHVLSTGSAAANGMLGLADLADAIHQRIKNEQFRDPLPLPRAPRAQDQELLRRGLFPNRWPAGSVTVTVVPPLALPDDAYLHVKDLANAVRVAVRHLIANLDLRDMTAAQMDAEREYLRLVAADTTPSEIWERLKEEPGLLSKAYSRFNVAFSLFIDQLPKTLRRLDHDLGEARTDMEKADSHWRAFAAGWRGHRAAVTAPPASETNGTAHPGVAAVPAGDAGAGVPKAGAGRGVRPAVPVATDGGTKGQPGAGVGKSGRGRGSRRRDG